MTEREVKELIKESIDDLVKYQEKALSRISNRVCNGSDIEEGRVLLEKILLGPIYRDSEDREIDYDSSPLEECVLKLNTEINRTNNVVRYIKGDISFEVYDKRRREIDEECS